MDIFSNGEWLPLVFALLMVVAVLAYAVLDGYDLGVGILMRNATEQERDVMIASIGPFWDANETWLVLAIGILLIAFPEANGIVLTNLYMPVCLMLVGLILRGVSFDFRAKVHNEKKALWDKAFIAGSLLTAMCQGYMLASYVLGFAHGVWPLLFCLMVAVCVAAGYSLIGASWLIMKTEGALQYKAVNWALKSMRGTALAIVAVSIATPAMSAHVFDRWTTYPDILILAPLPIVIVGLVAYLEVALRRMLVNPQTMCWRPFVMTGGLFIASLIALAYSFYPYIIPGQLKIVDAASAPESLMFILVGVVIVLPALIGYTFFAYRVFHGKTKELSYN
jgi:cytochrome d ubiquinol oxidase subunit II